MADPAFEAGGGQDYTFLFVQYTRLFAVQGRISNVLDFTEMSLPEPQNGGFGGPWPPKIFDFEVMFLCNVGFKMNVFKLIFRGNITILVI